MAKITFEDKVSVREINLPAENVVRAVDLTEIKNSVNALYDNPASPEAQEEVGTVISFDVLNVYGDYYIAETGNITDDLTDAKLGIVQKLYHESGSSPTVPSGWVLLGSGTYDTAVLNIIYMEWVGETRVEYWIVQEQ